MASLCVSIVLSFSSCFFIQTYTQKKYWFLGVDLCKCQRGGILFYEENCATRSHLYKTAHTSWAIPTMRKKKTKCAEKSGGQWICFPFFFLGALIKYHRCRLVGRYVYVSSRAYFAPFLNNNDYMGMRMGWCFESKLARKNQLL